MVNITVFDKENEYNLKSVKGEKLSKLLEKESLNINFPCRQNARCGKCRVQVVSGEVLPSEIDLKKLSKEEIDSGIRCSCRIYLQEDLTIKLI